MEFWNRKLPQTYYWWLEYAITAHYNRSFMLSVTHKNHDMCHGNADFDMFEIPVPYELPMGSWSGIVTSTTVHPL